LSLGLEDVVKNDLSTMGGKGASLSEMTNIGVPVPKGVLRNSSGIQGFHQQSWYYQEALRDLNVDFNQQTEHHKAEKMAKKLIMDFRVWKDVGQAIKSRIEKLCKREGEQVLVAVRSSTPRSSSNQLRRGLISPIFERSQWRRNIQNKYERMIRVDMPQFALDASTRQTPSCISIHNSH
jgi:hypothetical protein